jgi:carbamate kinase
VIASQLEGYYRAGHFPPGNMGPKVESVLRFLSSDGKEAIVTSHERLSKAVSGWAGTHIVPDNVADKITDLHEELEAAVTR